MREVRFYENTQDQAKLIVRSTSLTFRRDAGLVIFDKLHSRAHDEQVILCAFDLLEFEGEDWRPRPLQERKAKLRKLLTGARAGIQFSEHLDGDGGATIFAHACKLGLEGIVSKHRERPYRSGPSKTWLKIKNPSAPCVLRFKDPLPYGELIENVPSCSEMGIDFLGRRS